jgi:hypothetical protein
LEAIMGGGLRWLLALSMAGTLALAMTGEVRAASAPSVYSVIEGRDSASQRPVLVLVGKSLTKFTSFVLRDAQQQEVPAGAELILRSKTMVVVGLPQDLPGGRYSLAGIYAKTQEMAFAVDVGNGCPLPGTVDVGALGDALRTDLSDAETLQGLAPAFFLDASNQASGTLPTDRFSARADLEAEGAVGEGAAQVARGDHLHDGRYAASTALADPGTLNDAGNPVDWTRLKGVPTGFADGVDDAGQYTAGEGLGLAGAVFSVLYGGDGSAATAARSDHRHDGIYALLAHHHDGNYAALSHRHDADYAPLSHDHDARYFTESEADGRFPLRTDLSVAGTVNESSNPVDWSRLKGVPAGFADGLDDGAWVDMGSYAYRASGWVGIATPAPKANLHVAGYDGAVFTGSMGSGSIPATGAGTRMMWYPGKAAFRSGIAIATEWDAGSVGNYSVASGYNVTASGTASAAFGAGQRATGDYSAVLNIQNLASGYASLAAGNETFASGPVSTALGYATVSSNYYSTALGAYTTASGQTSLATGSNTSAVGFNTTAMGNYSMAIGNDSTALGYHSISSGYQSLATGNYTSAVGDWSTTMGYSTQAASQGCLALGRWNVGTGNPTAWVSTDSVLEVGNGSSASNRSNALTLYKNGNMTISGTLTENSDLRLKTDVAPLADALARLEGIRGVTYRMRDGERGPAGPQIGLVAQEVRAAFPELVKEDAEGTLSVAYGHFAAVLVEAVKEQQRVIRAQRKELDDVKARLARLEALLEGR